MATEKQTCDIAINYSEIIGERVLPFMISLDLARSVIMPAPGQNQRFCYNVTGVGSKMNAEADLDYLIFGISGDIPESLFANISVEVDGEPKQIFRGKRKRLSHNGGSFRPANRVLGLKFTFPLSKAGGVMRLCYGDLPAPGWEQPRPPVWRRNVGRRA